MTRKKQVARVAPGVTDRWFDAAGDRTSRYGHRGPAGARDPNRYLARWKPPHAKEQSRTFETVADAERWLRNQKTAYDNGEWIRPDRAKATLSEVRNAWWPIWLQGGSTGRKKPKPSSVVSYEQWWRLMVEPTFGSRPISSIRTAQISRWAADLAAGGLSGSTIRGGHSVLQLILDHAVHEERLLRNPARGARLPSRESGDVRRVLTAQQVDELSRAIVDATSRPQPQYGVLVTFLARTGLRFGEAAALRIGDLDRVRLDNGQMQHIINVRRTAVLLNGKLVEGLPKSGKVRTVSLPSALVPDIVNLISGRESSERLFTSPRGAQLRHDVFLKFHWNPTVLKLGHDGLTPHALRHSFASEALRRGVSLPAVSRQLGHANPAITARVYAHLLEDDLGVVGRAMDDAISDVHSEQRRNDGPDLRIV